MGKTLNPPTFRTFTIIVRTEFSLLRCVYNKAVCDISLDADEIQQAVLYIQHDYHYTARPEFTEIHQTLRAEYLF